MSRELTSDAVDEFQRKLCQVAARRFAQFGYAGVTLRAVAEELGCSRTTPYRYFKNKEQILWEVRADGFRRLAEAEEAAVRDEPDPARRLEALARAYLRFAADDPDSYRLMFETRDKVPTKPNAKQLAAVQRSQRPLFEAVSMAVEAGVVEGNAMTLTHLLWAALHGVISLHLADRLTAGRTFEQLSGEMVKLLANMIATPPRDNPRAEES